MRAISRAHPNIALVKYWGKRDERLILPHQSSVSVTLAPLEVVARVEFTAERGPDEVDINGRPAEGVELQRVTELVALVRRSVAGRRPGRAIVVTDGNFPKSAGLASSAAAFAALAVATRAAAGLPRDMKAESILARRGSGSAARSVHGGFVRWRRGTRPDGKDSFGEQLFDERHWPSLRLVVGLVAREEKEVKSRDGMRSTVKTSPYYPAWVKDAEKASRDIVRHLERRDLEAVGAIAESNAWRMHATALAAAPPLSYLRAATVEVIEACRRARATGVGVWFTLDAGPNPVLLTTRGDELKAVALLEEHGAREVVRCVPGGDATVVVEPKGS